jgi:Cu/Ag efflux pump CusA
MSRMGGEFIPALEEGDFAVDTRVLDRKQSEYYGRVYPKSSSYSSDPIS